MVSPKKANNYLVQRVLSMPIQNNKWVILKFVFNLLLLTQEIKLHGTNFLLMWGTFKRKGHSSGTN